MAYTPPVCNRSLSSHTVPLLSAVNFALSVFTPTPKFPDPADVRSGVVYGVSLEQTGTYSGGGGGGGEHSFTFIGGG